MRGEPRQLFRAAAPEMGVIDGRKVLGRGRPQGSPPCIYTTPAPTMIRGTGRGRPQGSPPRLRSTPAPTMITITLYEQADGYAGLDGEDIFVSGVAGRLFLFFAVAVQVEYEKFVEAAHEAAAHPA